MKAGFARSSITPPLGTMMMGFGIRDRDHGCEAIHDDVFVRALYLSHSGEEALVMGFDTCFVGREDADRMKGVLGRKLDLLPRQILMNTSHTHVGPSVGNWYAGEYTPPDRLYLRDLESAVLDAACRARESAREATMWAGVTRSSIPMNRRRREGGETLNAPNPGGVVCDLLPVCLFKDLDGDPISLLFSISCHPSMVSGYEISAEYPGAAMELIDAHLGTTGSLFLQGAGGNAKPSVIGRGVDRWRPGTWEHVKEAGGILAGEVISRLENGLQQIEPDIRTAMLEMEWPLTPAFERSEYEAIAVRKGDSPGRPDLKSVWAARQLERLDRYGALPTAAPLLAQGISLGEGMRIVAIEGELTAEHGLAILGFYNDGITIPLGYANGEGLYLVTSDMLDEGGMEVTSYWEYGFPSPLAKGMESVLVRTLGELRGSGI